VYNDKIKAEQVVQELFNNMDANGSGKVDFSEFIAAAMDKQKLLSRLKIEQSFKLFDLDGNGFITKSEIQELFGQGGIINQDLWNEILFECDKNGDGMVFSYNITFRFRYKNLLSY
jgi:calcium-dependent protein kinase